MVIERLINNNMVLSRGLRGEEVIVVGRGIGYAKKRGDAIPDDRIDKTYVTHGTAQTERLVALLEAMPLDDVLLADELNGHVKAHYPKRTNDMLLFVLMDHVSAALRRYERGIELSNPMLYDIKRIYPEEFAEASQLLAIISERRGIRLKEDEAGFIALNIVNAQLDQDMGAVNEVTHFVQRVLDIVRAHFDIHPTDDSMYYTRFLTHLKYLALRIVNKSKTSGDLMNRSFILNEIHRSEYGEVYEVIDEINAMTTSYYDRELTGDERLYLLLHLVTLLRALEEPRQSDDFGAGDATPP